MGALLARPAPWPYDLTFTIGSNVYGWMLERDGRGAPLYGEDLQDVEGGAARPALLSHMWSDLRDGVGLRLHQSGQELRYFDVGADAQFGGVDASQEGKLFLPTKMRSTTVYAGAHTVRAFAYYPGTGKYYAGIDDRLYESAGGTFSDAVQIASGGVPIGPNILALLPFQGNNAVSLLYLAYDDASAYTWDGTTFTPVGGSGGYTVEPTAVYKFVSPSTYTDYTAAATDADAGTAADFSSLGASDAIVLGSSEPFTKANFDVANTNAAAGITASAEYWNGTAWAALAGFTDGTASGGTTLAVDGTMQWTRPSAWAKAPLAATGSPDARYYMRVRFSGTLDASVTVPEIAVVLFSESAAWAVRGKHLGRIFDKNRLAVAEDGGVTPTWNSQPDPADDYSGDPVGLVATNDAWYFKNTSGLYSWDANGQAIAYLPDLRYSPDTSTTRAFTSWAGLVWFAHGASFWRFDPVEGKPYPWGPETLGAVETAPIFTTAVGDRDLALYCCGLNPAGDSWLWKLAGVGTDGRPAWHKQQYLGSETATASASWTVSGQPYLILGTASGKVFAKKLSKTGNALDVADYQDGIYGYLQLATWVGLGGDQYIVAGGATLLGRGIDGAAGQEVVVQTKQPQELSWTSQFTAVGHGRGTFGTPYGGLGIDQRLALKTDDAALSPVVEGYWLFWHHQPRRVLRAYRLTLRLAGGRVGDPVKDRRGAPLPPTTGTVDALDAAMLATTLTLRRPDGTTDTVRMQGWRVVAVAGRKGETMRQAAQVTLATVG